MANSVTALFKEVWAKKMEVTYLKENQSEVFADMSFNSDLQSGDVLHRQLDSIDANAAPGIHTRGSEISATALSVSDETLTINREFATLFYVDKFDEKQSDIGIASHFAGQYGTLMKNQIDADTFGEVSNATSTVDAGDVSGTAGQGITLATTNVLQVMAAVRKKIKKLNVPTENLKGAISPEFVEVLTIYGAGRDTSMGDDIVRKGWYGKFNSVDLYETNNLTGSAVLALATQPTANDTVTIQGQVFTFVSSIGTTAGNVLIGASVDATRANLATLINAPQTTTATGVALTDQNLKNFQARATAVNDNTANTLKVTYKGAGSIEVSETLTDGTDTWTAALQKQHCLFVANKGPALVIQQTPNVMIKEEPRMNGANTIMTCLYGLKTYSDQAKRMVNVELNSSSF